VREQFLASLDPKALLSLEQLNRSSAPKKSQVFEKEDS